MLLKSVTLWSLLIMGFFRNQVRNGFEVTNQTIDTYANGSFYAALTMKFITLFGIGAIINFIMLYDLSNYLNKTQKSLEGDNEENENNQDGIEPMDISDNEPEDDEDDSTYIQSHDQSTENSDVPELVRTQSYDEQMLREHFQRSDSIHSY